MDIISSVKVLDLKGSISNMIRPFQSTAQRVAHETHQEHHISFKMKKLFSLEYEAYFVERDIIFMIIQTSFMWWEPQKHELDCHENKVTVQNIPISLFWLKQYFSFDFSYTMWPGHVSVSFTPNITADESSIRRTSSSSNEQNKPIGWLIRIIAFLHDVLKNIRDLYMWTLRTSQTCTPFSVETTQIRMEESSTRVKRKHAYGKVKIINVAPFVTFWDKSWSTWSFGILMKSLFIFTQKSQYGFVHPRVRVSIAVVWIGRLFMIQ